MDFKCLLCNKNYKSYQSLWNHNKIKHNDIKIKNQEQKKFQCQNCNKKFTRKTNLEYHLENACKNNKITELEKKIQELQAQLKNNNNTINNNTNNGTINNIKIVINKVGSESIYELNDQEVKEIFDNKLESVVKFIQHLNFNKRLPSNHNFYTTSLDGKYLSIYNTDHQVPLELCSSARFNPLGLNVQEKQRKKYFFEDLLSRSIGKMEMLYKRYKNKFNKNKQKQIEEDIDILKEIQNKDMNDVILKEMLNKLNLLSYNYKKIVLDTWSNTDTNIKEETFEDDLNNNDDDIKEIEDLFIKANNSESDDSSERISLGLKKVL
jgi:hypothetical protein